MLTHLAAAYVLVWRDAILNAPEGSSAIKQLFARDAGTSLERLLEKAYLLKESPAAHDHARADEDRGRGRQARPATRGPASRRSSAAPSSGSRRR